MENSLLLQQVSKLYTLPLFDLFQKEYDKYFAIYIKKEMKVNQIMNILFICAMRMQSLKYHLILSLAQFHVVTGSLRLLALYVFMRSRFLM